MGSEKEKNERNNKTRTDSARTRLKGYLNEWEKKS